MTLKDWLAEHSLTPNQFGQTIGRSSEAVRRYVNGDRIPDRVTMPLIVTATDGAVTPNDFFDLSAAEQAAA